jgi:hypothetical protein
LTPIQTNRSRLRLRVVCGTPNQEAAHADSGGAPAGAGLDLPRLEALLNLLRGQRGGDTTVVHLLEPGSRIELSRIGTADALDRIAQPAWQPSLMSASNRGQVVLADF